MNADPVSVIEALRAQLPGAAGDDDTPGLHIPAAPVWQPPRTPMAEDDRAALRDYLTGRMHADDTAVGFLHRGGCGCHYIAALVVDTITVAQPVTVE